MPGAVGYVISRATSSGGPYTYLQTVTETTYTDYGLNPAVIYYYRVAAMNAAGVTGNNTDLGQQPAVVSDEPDGDGDQRANHLDLAGHHRRHQLHFEARPQRGQ